MSSSTPVTAASLVPPTPVSNDVRTFDDVAVRLPFTDSPEGYARSTDASSSAPDHTAATTMPPNAPPSTSPKISACVRWATFVHPPAEIITPSVSSREHDVANSSSAPVTSADTAVAPTRDPPPLVKIADIPTRIQELLRAAILQTFGIATPRPFQIEAINHCTFEDDTYISINRGTADGKSLVPQTLTITRRGVALIMVPLVGLGTDQVEKAQLVDHGIESYHIDEHKKHDEQRLMRRLLSATADELKYCRIMAFVGPGTLLNPKWGRIWETLARRGFISYFCIDEAHEVEQSGRSFRPVFKEAVAFIPRLLRLMPQRAPRIILSASMRKRDEDVVTKLLGDMSPNVLCGPLARRNIKFTVSISGNEAKSLTTSAQSHLHGSPEFQQIWFTHSRTNAEGSLLNAALTELEHNRAGGGPNSIAHSFTGGDGIMMKATTMDAVMAYERLDGEGTIFDDVLSEEGLQSLLRMGSSEDEGDYSLSLPKVQIVVGTKALQCGVSGNYIKHAFKKGFPTNMYELVQELGRVDRQRNAEPGTNTYEIHVSFNSYISIFVRIMQNDDGAQRQVQLRQLHEVLEFLLVPTTCFHSTIEHYFERRMEGDKCNCGHYCSFCREEHHDYTGKIFKKGLLHVLLTKLFSSTKAPTCNELIKHLKSGKEKDISC